MSQNKTEAIVFTWDQDSSQFQKSDHSLVVPGTILGVATGDINWDGRLDAVVTWKEGDETIVQLFESTEDGFSEGLRMTVEPDSQPAVIDLLGDTKYFLNRMKIIVKAAGNKVLAYSYSDEGNFIQTDLLSYVSKSQGCKEVDKVLLSTPDSFSFVDLNKDCVADLFLTTLDEKGELWFEVWLNMQGTGFCSVFKEKAPAGAGHVTFVDVNKDGTEDLVFPVFGEHKDEIHIVFNKNDVSDSCNYNANKVNQDSFRLSLSHDSKIVVLESPKRLRPNNPIYPNILRFGDFNLDGYPDMLVNVYENKTPFFQLYENNEGTFKLSSDEQFKKLEDIKGAYIGAFLDLDENEIPDILIQHSVAGTEQITAFYNNFLSDTFHLKALALNGYSKGKYSSSYPGAVFMFTITELDMKKVVIHTTQAPQSAYSAMTPPYCIYGLGRTNSYVEEFYVALPNGKHRVWTPIIPNSYLIISPDNEVGNWFLELFASPTDKIGVIITVAVGFLVVLGTVAMLKYMKERRQDKERGRINL